MSEQVSSVTYKMLIKNLFDAFDKDKNGSLNVHETKDLLRYVEKNINNPLFKIDDQFVMRFFKSVDTDNSGSITFEEFYGALNKFLDPSQN